MIMLTYQPSFDVSQRQALPFALMAVPAGNINYTVASDRLLTNGAAPAFDSGLMPLLAINQQMTQLLLQMSMLVVNLMTNTSGVNGGKAALDLSGNQATGVNYNGNAGGGAQGGVNSSGSTAAALQNGPKVGSPKVQKLIDSALSKQGTPYVFGASGPDKFDCSGLVSWALGQAGASGGRTNAEGLRRRYAGNKVSKEELQPGDLVFFWYPNKRGIPKGQASHVEIYLGNGKTMGTDSPKEKAQVESIDWSGFIGGARPPELQR